MPTDLTPEEEAQLEAIENDMIARGGNPQEEDAEEEPPKVAETPAEASPQVVAAEAGAKESERAVEQPLQDGGSDAPQKKEALESPTIPEQTKSQENTASLSSSALLEGATLAPTQKGQYSAQATLSTPPQVDSPTEQAQDSQPVINKGTCDPSRIYALIENNEIRDIFRGDALPEYNADQLDIRVLPAGQERLYAVGLPLKDNQLQPLSLEQIKERQLSFINEDFEGEILAVQNEYIPLEEILTFELQRQEALNLQKGGETPFLDKLAGTRGESKEALAAKILKKHEDYMQTLAVLLGNRHKLRNQIEQSKDPEEIMKIIYKSPLKSK